MWLKVFLDLIPIILKLIITIIFLGMINSLCNDVEYQKLQLEKIDFILLFLIYYTISDKPKN